MKLKLFSNRTNAELVTWPWLCTYFIWQSLVTSSHWDDPRRHRYVTALFVNVVFNNEDKILLKIYQLKGYITKQLRKEFPDIRWTKGSINRLLKKFRDTGTVDRRQGSGRREVPARIQTLTRWNIWFWLNKTSPELTAQSVKYHGDRHS